MMRKRETVEKDMPQQLGYICRYSFGNPQFSLAELQMPKKAYGTNSVLDKILKYYLTFPLSL